jgi:hypothetical protein
MFDRVDPIDVIAYGGHIDQIGAMDGQRSLHPTDVAVRTDVFLIPSINAWWPAKCSSAIKWSRFVNITRTPPLLFTD